MGKSESPENFAKKLPPQHQKSQPGMEYKMDPEPVYIREGYKGSNKLLDKVTIITGGDSGIGRAVAVHFAREGSDVAVVYLEEDKDAKKTSELVENEGRKCLLIKGDLSIPAFSKDIVEKVIDEFGRIDILVNNAAEQHEAKKIRDITDEQVEQTFRTNIFSMIYLTREVMPHLEKGGTIINTTSITAYQGSDHLMDYAATKGAILSFTRSLSANLAKKGIRVNGVAPGPIWTPLIPASFPASEVAKFGSEQPLGRPGQPCEVATCFVFLASEDASYMTGQVLHPNGGEIVGG